MVTTPIDPNPRLFAPRYSHAEADRIAGATRGTTKRWLKGHPYQDAGGAQRFSGLVTERERPEGDVSFADLVEIAAIDRWKELGYSLRKIREIVRQCQQIFGVPHPLITMRFKVRGQHAFVEEKGNFVGLLGKKRQLAWERIFAFLATVEYEGGFATRWWPLGKDGKVLVDPD